MDGRRVEDCGRSLPDAVKWGKQLRSGDGAAPRPKRAIGVGHDDRKPDDASATDDESSDRDDHERCSTTTLVRGL